mmetsp:Transcript_1742/g.1944  ORF Transcript_1742/g.1944 Transcript_1742/m.1944 type:complete len:392 (-) Transcript_1742:309-1484(-)|eukprot:CAMPEP_0197843436 /NCGR_PEP_ID=MMETSP1438-20131217/303_1 /TAXON_ID=1461541 /ORGANISM="Pterosperma sp., Strain CCMP1384" /LENGTH=391 /DNA_ID=CAMNT_0043453591 /DNA_START=64 /DNA_END=1239 /DNA_ORIENTATION=-
MAARPLITVQSLDGASTEQVPLPPVFLTPIRPDLVQTVHTNMAKNHRQPYSVSKYAGHQTSAESWGTGRAVSRIPRVPGGGTHRAGQGAFGNMCRGGRMFSPTKVWRKWHRKVNLKEKRYAVCSALAAAALPSLVMARGHKVDDVPELPLVVSDAAEAVTKTSKALEVVKKLGLTADVEKVKASKNLRVGKGKMRNRRYVQRKGPLVIYSGDAGISKAFRNIPGVELASVDRLNLLQLAPGGHMGRLIVWTKSAVAKLDGLYGTATKGSESKKGWTLPRAMMTNSDLNRVINSDEVQSVVLPPKDGKTSKSLKKNPLKNLGAMLKLNPYAQTAKRMALLAESKRKTVKADKLAKKRDAAVKVSGKKFYKGMMVDSAYKGEDYDNFSTWLQA